MDVINKISCAVSSDAAHYAYFMRDGIVQKMSLAEVDQQAAAVAFYLKELGVGHGDRIGGLAKNGIEWVILDLAVLKAGAITVGFDLGRFEIDVAARSYGLKFLFIDKKTDDSPHILDMENVRQWANSKKQWSSSIPLHNGYKLNEPCAIKFTSGSTAEAKGLEATVASINDSLSSVQEMFQHGSGDNILLFQRQSLLQQRYWVYSAFAYGHDLTIASPDTVLPVAQAAHPTVIMGVPGFYTDLKRQLEKSTAYAPDDLAARRNSIQSTFGGRIRYLWTGSAPASRATLDYFNDCGVPLYEGYGLNETCIVAKNCPREHRVGSVGKVLPNKTVRFDSDGMLVVGSRNPVARQYLFCAPGDNERMFLPSGEVRTQDLAYLDKDNFLYIHGRFDELIALSCGRKVIVRPIEERMRLHPDVHECVLYGIGKPFLTALISPAEDVVDRESIERHIRALNADLQREQQIQVGGLVISNEPFSIENGLLTVQLKPIRKEIYKRLDNEIEAVYEKTGANVA